MNIYMDESGSVHPAFSGWNRFFVIGIIIPTDAERLRSVYKIFVRKNYENLQKLDMEHKMFDKNGKFVELKGACFNRKMKEKFMEFFCQNDLFKVGYIILDNNKLQKKFISNKARTFNYLLKLFLSNAIAKKYITEKDLYLNIDERNVRTESRFSLEDYLNQELVLNSELIDNAKVRYFDSSRNQLIQVADVFSNIMYSNIVTKGVYNDTLTKLKKEGYILPYFLFPK